MSADATTHGAPVSLRRRLWALLSGPFRRPPCQKCVEANARYVARLERERVQHERIAALAQERDRLRAELEEERRLAAGARTAFLSQIEAIEARVEELKDVIADQVRRLGTAEVEDRRVARFIDDLGRAVASAHAAGVTKPKRRR